MKKESTFRGAPAALRGIRTALVVLILVALAGCGRGTIANVGLKMEETATQVAGSRLPVAAKTAAVAVEPTADATPLPTGTATDAPTAELTATPSATATATLTASPEVTLMPAGTATVTPTMTLTASPTVTASPTATATVVPVNLNETENILVLGADVRPGPWMMHTDSIMLVAIDRQNGQVGILSIPRDLWVDIPNWGADRINSAYFLGGYIKYTGGGPALAAKVVEDALGVPVDHTVLIKMDGLAKLVDAIGGVTVHLDCPLYEQTPDPRNPKRMVNWQLPAGDVKLDGAAARKYATYRYLTSDFGRAQRQQQLIWAIRERAQTENLLPRIPELWTALGGTFETDMNVIDVARLAKFGLDLQPGNLHGAALDREVVKPFVTGGGASVLVIKDQASLDKRLETLFSGQPLSDLGKQDAAKCLPKPAGFN